MRKLKTIAEHENDVFTRQNNKRLTGIECPNCKAELQFANDIVLTSYPPQRSVVCFSCNYTKNIYV
jgi:C4-type Zn-finger protein